MLKEYAIVPYQRQANAFALPANVLSRQYGQQLQQLLHPLVQQLDAQMDKRPLRTLVQAVEAILVFRDRHHGLLLSQLGDAMDGLEGGGGGTKRLGTLIRHRGWKAQQIEQSLLQRADEQVQRWQEQGEEGLLIWDGTVLEKPESLHAEGLCPVRSSKAGRLTRIKKGYYHPPGRPICVPGLHGIGLLLAARSAAQGPAQVALMRWWTSRGPLASYEKDENCKLLRLTAARWGRQLIHVFDRGYGTGPWLGALRGFGVRFIVRWKTRSHLLDAAGVKQAAWKIGRGKRGLAPRTLYDAVHHCNQEGSVLFFPVRHPDFPDWSLTLVIARRKGGSPWYLLTNEPVSTAEDAWKIVMAYARRWQIEMAFRNLKSELAIESLRVYDWEARLKLLGLLTLAYAFLMQLLAPPGKAAREALLAYGCPRTGRHLQESQIPFTRLRIALAKLWLAHPCWFVRRLPLRL